MSAPAMLLLVIFAYTEARFVLIRWYIVVNIYMFPHIFFLGFTRYVSKIEFWYTLTSCHLMLQYMYIYLSVSI